MGQSLVKNYIHIVFGTKHREKLILPSFREELYAYIGGVCKEMACPPVIVGGYYDHIHILCNLSKKVTIVELIKQVKGSSSKWVKSVEGASSNFYWQDGYGAFSVDYRNIDTVANYIKRQDEHHAKKSFRDEYLKLLKENEVEYNEDYLWS